ncbi:MAG TPA: [protein-PII] uridylyltransferase [Steroidobacteraceae bacterium]|nr:[protein-PII] uridylyltransferase [Steroidobacteraceae bacterium]
MNSPVAYDDVEPGAAAPAPQPPWPFLATLPDALRASDPAISAFRQALVDGDASLKQRFADDEPVEELVRDRARMVDVVLRSAWALHVGPHAKEVNLIAVGGYGRGELHPCSDIDVLILLPKSEVVEAEAGIERFLTFLWDIGLEVGHSVRTIDDCQRESAADVSVATTFIEARLLAGPEHLFQSMRRALGQDKVWSSKAFFEAKVAEQQTRHHRYHDTGYNLEPNVKASPGGLRDIQTIGWVAKRHFGAETLDELVGHGFLTAAELRKLRQAQSFLWKVRFALHALNGRREDRLLFDHQIRLAKMFGYEDATYTLAVEQFMQRYYRTVMDVSLLNEMLLQLFREAILTGDGESTIVPLNPRFQLRNDFLEVTSDDTFVRNPSAILELFRVMQDTPGIRGVRATTIRLLGRHLWLIDEEFRQNPRHHRLFLELLRAPVGVTHELRRMNLYGVLGRYIPAFGRVVGRMQYDLFHAYTVDAHILFVLRNLRRLALPRFEHELPEMSRLMATLQRPEVAYLAALFHDIAKGRGGDHSELGAVDAEAFCLEQGLSRYDARLVAWLVRNHLIFSVTAQKKDISDPKVIQEFARTVGDQTHLDYLYLLTVADVRGTNPKLWNSWKSSLFHDFYERVRRALRRGLEAPLEQEELVAETKAHTLELLDLEHVSRERAAQIWSRFNDMYFLRYSPAEIAWQTKLLAATEPEDVSLLVAVRTEVERGGNAVLTVGPHRQQNFARTTALLDQMGLNIVDARITPLDGGLGLDTYLVLEDTGHPIADRQRAQQIELQLRRVLQSSEADLPVVTRRAPRQVRMFSTPTQISFSEDPLQNRTVLEIIAGDRPGLLSEIGKVFLAEQIDVVTAKVMTIGERAEDVFYVTDGKGRPLGEPARKRLQDSLTAALDRRETQARLA